MPGQRTHGWVIGRVWGARVILQPMTLVMIGGLGLLWGTGGDGRLTGTSLGRGVGLAVLLFLSVFIHEWGHALAARLFHREIKELVITLWGGHTSFDGKAMTPGVSGLTALAGPLMNAVLALISAGMLQFDLGPGAHQVFGWLAYANTALAIFNVLPGIPMDGGRVCEAIVWKATGNRMAGLRASAWSGRVVAIGVVVYVLTSGFSGRAPDMFSIIWSVFLFSMFWPATTMALKVARTVDKVDLASVARVMRSAVGVPFDVTVEKAIAVAQEAGADEVVIMSVDGHPAGHFGLGVALEVPETRRATTGLSAVTLPLFRGATVAADFTGPELLEAARQWWGKTDALVVVDGGEVVGLVRLSEVSARLK